MRRGRDLMPTEASSVVSAANLVPRIVTAPEQARNYGSSSTTTSLLSSTPSSSVISPYVEYGTSHLTTNNSLPKANNETLTTGISIDNRTTFNPFLGQSFPDLSLERPSIAGLPSHSQQEPIPDKEDINLPPNKVCALALSALCCSAVTNDFQFNWEHQGDFCFRSRRSFSS